MGDNLVNRRVFTQYCKPCYDCSIVTKKGEDMKLTTHLCNLETFKKFSINDKVMFYTSDTGENFGLVTGFTVNSLGELLVSVLEIYSGKQRELHPENGLTDLRKI
jgi:hypothetical protein